MVGGIVEFRRIHPNKAKKIDDDAAIPAVIRNGFWQEVEGWTRGNIERFTERCCTKRQFCGPKIVLGAGERVGHAQKRAVLASALARQKPRRLPALLRAQVDLYLAMVVREPDRNHALTFFKSKFGKLRLRSIRGGKTKTRIFGFRNPASPSDPLQFSDLPSSFMKLSIPAASSADYLIIAYQPAADDLVHHPTCFDANMRNLEDFSPGGKTAGGIDEVITTPPRCIHVTHAPQSVT
jgi:hypothetical protein